MVTGSCSLIQNGNGASASAMKPNKLLPHPKPRASYIDNPANGNTAPATDRTTVLAASELAANTVNASTRYLSHTVFVLVPSSYCSCNSAGGFLQAFTHSWRLIKIMMFPIPIMPVPIIGTIQWTWYWAVHP